MQESGSSFTGRARQRKTSRKVLLADRVARTLISVGGIGTIFAVLGVCVFLVWVVVPLFLPAAIGNLDSFASDVDQIMHLEMDEYGLLAWMLRPSGKIEVFRLDNGELRQTLDVAPKARLTASSHLIRGDLTLFGREDGQVQLAAVGFEPSVVDAEDLPREVVEALEQEGVTTVDHGEGVVEATPNGQYRTQKLRAELGEVTRVGAGPVHLVSHVIGPNGPLIAAVVADVDRAAGAPVDASSGGAPVEEAPGEQGVVAETAPEPDHLHLVVIEGIETSNFLTGETTLEVREQVEIPTELSLDDPPVHLALAGAGDTLYLAWADGRLQRYDTSELGASRLVESGGLVEPGRELETLLFGLGSQFGPEGVAIAGLGQLLALHLVSRYWTIRHWKVDCAATAFLALRWYDKRARETGDEPGGIVREVRGDDVEHGVTEAADVQDVVALRRLRRSIRLQVDADQLW